jgi:hypothetical protein
MIAIIAARYNQREALEMFLGGLFPGQATVDVRTDLSF